MQERKKKNFVGRKLSCTATTTTHQRGWGKKILNDRILLQNDEMFMGIFPSPQKKKLQKEIKCRNLSTID